MVNNAERLIAHVSSLTRRITRRQGELILQVGEMIRRRGLTQRKLAKAAGLTEQHLSRMLAGDANVELKTICQLEEALGEEIIKFPIQTILQRRREWHLMEQMAVELRHGATAPELSASSVRTPPNVIPLLTRPDAASVTGGMAGEVQFRLVK